LAIVKSKLLKQLSKSFPNVLKKDLEKFIDIVLKEIKLSLKRNDEKSLKKTEEINNKLMPLHKALFIESNPSPVKYAASLLNLSSEDVRLPLVKITEKTKKEIKKALKVAQLL